MAFIKSISELPSWFNLDKYEASQNKSKAENFLQQLLYRISLVRLLNDKDLFIPIKINAKQYDEYTVYDFGCIPYILIEEYEAVKNEKITPESNYWDYYQAILKYALEIIRVDPLLENGFGVLEEDHQYAWIHCLRDTLTIYRQNEKRPISDLSIYEVGEMFTLLPQGVKKYLINEFHGVHDTEYFESLKEHLDALGQSSALDGYKHEIESDDVDRVSMEYINSLSEEDFMELESYTQKKFLDFERENIHTPPIYIQPVIKVDLTCSDTVLKEQFNVWLTQQRKNLYKLDLDDQLNIKPSVKRTGESLFYKLQDYKVLAYMDLCIWAVLNNHKIKRSVLAHALYIDRYDSEFIRKNLIPLIGKLFDRHSSEIAELFSYKNMEDFSS